LVSNDSLVRKKWAEWRRFDIDWSKNDIDKWLAYKDKRGPELTETALKWKIFCHPKKDNGEENKESVSFTREFQSFWRPEMKYLFDANDPIMDDIIRNKEFSAFAEYGFVQIIPAYIGMDNKDFYNLPRRDPEKLKTIFELAQMVFRLFDNEFNEGNWDKIGERQEEMLKEREEFRKKAGMYRSITSSTTKTKNRADIDNPPLMPRVQNNRVNDDDNDNNDTTNDWADWVPIAMEPKEEYYAELDYCRENNIPTRIKRLRDADTGREYLMVLKKKGFPKSEDEKENKKKRKS
jgi:hypothetical protein